MDKNNVDNQNNKLYYKKPYYNKNYDNDSNNKNNNNNNNKTKNNNNYYKNNNHYKNNNYCKNNNSNNNANNSISTMKYNIILKKLDILNDKYTNLDKKYEILDKRYCKLKNMCVDTLKKNLENDTKHNNFEDSVIHNNNYVKANEDINNENINNEDIQEKDAHFAGLLNFLVKLKEIKDSNNPVEKDIKIEKPKINLLTHDSLKFHSINLNLDSITDFIELAIYFINIKKEFEFELIESNIIYNFEEDGEYLDYYVYCNKKYTINVDKVLKLQNPLTKLYNLIGMNDVKKKMVNILCNHLIPGTTNNNYTSHTLIYGPPGVGKTKLSKIICNIYYALGIISTNNIIKATRANLIGQHLGSTAIKTQELINSAANGILLIDEGYSLGNEETRDSFSKECIDTLTLNLSDKTKKFVCIVIGYEESIKKNLFNYNQGLEGRFTKIYKIDGYSTVELKNIFIYYLNKHKYSLDNILNKELLDIFEKNKKAFPNFGRDIKTLLYDCMCSHHKLIVGKQYPITYVMTKEIILENLSNKKYQDNGCTSYFC